MPVQVTWYLRYLYSDRSFFHCSFGWCHCCTSSTVTSSSPAPNSANSTNDPTPSSTACFLLLGLSTPVFKHTILCDSAFKSTTRRQCSSELTKQCVAATCYPQATVDFAEKGFNSITSGSFVALQHCYPEPSPRRIPAHHSLKGNV